VLHKIVNENIVRFNIVRIIQVMDILLIKKKNIKNLYRIFDSKIKKRINSFYYNEKNTGISIDNVEYLQTIKNLNKFYLREKYLIIIRH
jgi:hypothetical protein